MNIKRYIRRITAIANNVPKLRNHSHVLLISAGEYDEIANKLGMDQSDEKKYITVAKLVLVKAPQIGKRRYQVMPWREYVALWDKYKKIAERQAKVNAEMTKQVKKNKKEAKVG